VSLYHYTCDHGRDALGDEGWLRTGHALNPKTSHLWQAGYIWLTDLSVPIKDALGLTSNFIHCDRTEHRYLIDPAFEYVTPYMSIRKHLSFAKRMQLEESPGARPMHWYVTRVPVLATYSPREGTDA
jgi:hypothetical protein